MSGENANQRACFEALCRRLDVDPAQLAQMKAS
jgi:hypothetical protein